MHVALIVAAIGVVADTVWAASVLTGNYNNARTNANLSETTLNAANVGLVRKLGVYSVSGAVYAQPLVVDGVSVGGAGRLLIVASMGNVVYAFNADTPGSSPIWTRSVGTPYTPGANVDAIRNGTVGCLATPTIDATAQLVYALCATSTGLWKLYALKFADGTDSVSPVTLSGTSKGLTFDSVRHLCRAGLTLANSNVYVACGSYGDSLPFQGWMFAYNSTSLAAVAAWSTVNSSNGAGGIWMSGGGPSVDDSGNLYILTGNGDRDGGNNLGESFVKLSSTLTVLDSFTPSNWVALNAIDGDLGSSRAIVYGSNVMGGGKDGRWWTFAQSSLGGLEGAGGNPVQAWQAVVVPGGSQVKQSTIFADNILFVGAGGVMNRYSYSGTAFTTTASATVDTGAQNTTAYTSNGGVSGTGLVWTFHLIAGLGSVGWLTAYDASNLSALYQSTAAEAIELMPHLATPTVVNGKVYLATFSNGIAVYGLPSVATRGNATIRGTATMRVT